MAKLVCADRLTFLSDRHKDLLSAHFKSPIVAAQPRGLAIKLGVEYSQVIAVLAVLASDGLCRNWLLIYHNCSDSFVDRSLLNKGMPPLPYTCPYCEVDIYSYDELQFDLMVETDTSVEFI